MIIKTKILRVIIATFFVLILVVTFDAVVQYLHMGKCSSLFFVSYLIPGFILAIVAILTYTPSYLTINEEEIVITYLFRNKKKVPLSSIKAYGKSQNAYNFSFLSKIKIV